jgi:hypothetical protein
MQYNPMISPLLLLLLLSSFQYEKTKSYPYSIPPVYLSPLSKRAILYSTKGRCGRSCKSRGKGEVLFHTNTWVFFMDVVKEDALVGRRRAFFFLFLSYGPCMSSLPSFYWCSYQLRWDTSHKQTKTRKVLKLFCNIVCFPFLLITSRY